MHRLYNADVWYSLVSCREWNRLQTHLWHRSAPFRPAGEDQLEDLVKHGWQTITNDLEQLGISVGMNWLQMAYSDWG